MEKTPEPVAYHFINQTLTPKEKRIIAMIFFAIPLAWLTSGLAVGFYFGDWGVSGTFGDTFGFINSLFSGLAFAGVIFTIILQNRELAEQRRELKRTADAQIRSQKALNEQVQSLRTTALLSALSYMLEGSETLLKGEAIAPDLREEVLADRIMYYHRLKTYVEAVLNESGPEKIAEQ